MLDLLKLPHHTILLMLCSRVIASLLLQPFVSIQPLGNSPSAMPKLSSPD